MSKYIIEITKTYKSDLTLEIEASSPEEAREMATQKLQEHTFTEFEEIDLIVNDPYLDEEENSLLLKNSTENVLSLYSTPEKIITIKTGPSRKRVQEEGLIRILSDHLKIKNSSFVIKEQELTSNIYIKHPLKEENVKIIRVYVTQKSDEIMFEFGLGKFYHHSECGYMFERFEDIE